jgi:hypothetical protein
MSRVSLRVRRQRRHGTQRGTRSPGFRSQGSIAINTAPLLAALLWANDRRVGLIEAFYAHEQPPSETD